MRGVGVFQVGGVGAVVGKLVVALKHLPAHIEIKMPREPVGVFVGRGVVPGHVNVEFRAVYLDYVPGVVV